MTDHETGTDIDAAVLEAVRGVDVLIHDAQYLPSEVESHRGWGHSTYADAIALATRTGTDVFAERALLDEAGVEIRDADEEAEIEYVED